ncbi:MAG: 3-phosphoserine/phosphohydroxythreonine transaminase [Lentisphaerae bacterium]|nr:3-phosphoserine/phosphohydroxythreonine transaminase [Lentisphaerota bacterium]
MTRAYNFGAGPSTLPLEVLTEAQSEFLDYAGSGMSIIESSHRGKEFDAVHNEAIANVKKLFALDDNYSVLFLPGGASFQFAMLPLNLLSPNACADYTNTGAWASKAIQAAQTVGKVNIAADTSKDRPMRIPALSDLNLTENAAYLHVTSNETIAGTQWKKFPETDIPLVADMSSDILSRPIDANKFALIYAGAQKNIGPSGIALTIIRNDLAKRTLETVPEILRYKTHIDNNSLFNTPPTFGIYIITLVTRWLLKEGLENVFARNVEKAAKIYDVIDSGDFYKGVAVKEDRSDMNVTFRLPTEELEIRFIAEAASNNLKGLKGHRSAGGIRASIYNAFPMEGIDVFVSFMKEFEAKNG